MQAVELNCLLPEGSDTPLDGEICRGVVAAPELKIELTDSPYIIAQREAEKKQAEVRAIATKKRAVRPNLTVNSGVYVAGDVEVLDSGRPEYFNCVAYVRSKRFMPKTANGNAGTTPINQKTPSVGAIAVMPGHVGLVERINGDTIIITDSNYIRGKLTRRSVPRSAIKGYFN